MLLRVTDVRGYNGIQKFPDTKQWLLFFRPGMYSMQWLLFSKRGLHNFSKNLGRTTKFWASGGCQGKLRIVDTGVFSSMLQNLVARASYHPEFVHL